MSDPPATMKETKGKKMKVTLRNKVDGVWYTTFYAIDFDDERLHKWVATYQRNNVPFTITEVM